MFFPLKLLLMELPLFHLFSHICCVVHLEKLNTFFLLFSFQKQASRAELENNMEVWNSLQSVCWEDAQLNYLEGTVFI